MTTTKSLSPTTGAGTHKQAWTMTLMLVALYMLNWADKAVLGIVAQPLKDEFGFTAAQIGLAGSLFYLTFSLGGFLAGPLNRWLGLRWALVIMAVVWAASMLPMVFAASFAVLIASRCLLGLGEGPNSALANTAAFSWFPEEKRGLPAAAIISGGSIAKIAFAPILAVVTSTFGWRAAFITLAISALVWVPIWMALWRPGPYGEQTDTGKKVRQDPGMRAANRASLRRTMLTPTFIGGFFAATAMYAIAAMVITWLPSYLEVGLGYSRVAAGSMLAFPSIAGFVWMLSISALTDRAVSRGASVRLMRAVIPTLGLVICGLTLVAVPYIGSAVLVVVFISIGYGLGLGILPQLNAVMSMIFPRHQVAGGLGIFLALTSLGPLVAPYITGLIIDGAADPAAGYATAFQAIGAVAVTGAVIALLAVNPTRDRAHVDQ
ncbi:MFS transporter [Rhodococcus erythropolis]|uniref:MFS transporter n=1 Tax=Rhodococcus erythropolis TaxID=1833 RepID=UPI00210DEA0C|nr:MFS transporter [Rhodococcus erythropolis]MCQ4129060.1 MFS transporter [Rhodococcus erythropolis]